MELYCSKPSTRYKANSDEAWSNVLSFFYVVAESMFNMSQWTRILHVSPLEADAEST
jgi:hypothetical protein